MSALHHRVRSIAALLGVMLLTSSGTPARAVDAVPTGSTTSPGSGVWPLEPRPVVVREFDPPPVAWASGHRGVDLAGRVGQPVRAAVSGRVTFAGRIAGVGTVVVGHGATRTTYQPVGLAVARGDRVVAGERIGRLEWRGTHCFPAACLHWGLLRGERYLDPLALLDVPRPVRLLPAPDRVQAPFRLVGVPAGRRLGVVPW